MAVARRPYPVALGGFVEQRTEKKRSETEREAARRDYRELTEVDKRRRRVLDEQVAAYEAEARRRREEMARLAEIASQEFSWVSATVAPPVAAAAAAAVDATDAILVAVAAEAAMVAAAAAADNTTAAPAAAEDGEVSTGQGGAIKHHGNGGGRQQRRPKKRRNNSGGRGSRTSYSSPPSSSPSSCTGSTCDGYRGGLRDIGLHEADFRGLSAFARAGNFRSSAAKESCLALISEISSAIRPEQRKNVVGHLLDDLSSLSLQLQEQLARLMVALRDARPADRRVLAGDAGRSGTTTSSAGRHSQVEAFPSSSDGTRGVDVGGTSPAAGISGVPDAGAGARGAGARGSGARGIGGNEGGAARGNTPQPGGRGGSGRGGRRGERRRETGPAGAAGPGEVFVLSDPEIEKLGVRALSQTLRSLEGVRFSRVRKPELRATTLCSNAVCGMVREGSPTCEHASAFFFFVRLPVLVGNEFIRKFVYYLLVAEEASKFFFFTFLSCIMTGIPGPFGFLTLLSQISNEVEGGVPWHACGGAAGS